MGLTLRGGGSGGGSATPNAALDAAYAALSKVATTASADGAAVVNKHNPVDASGATRAISLPTGRPEGTQVSVEKVDSSTNLVNVTGNIRGVGSSTLGLAWQFESIMLRADSAGSWWPVAGHKTKTAIDAAITAAPFVAKWLPSHAYTAGDIVMAPDGTIVQRIGTGTSGSSYSGANWTVVAGGSGSAWATVTYAGSVGASRPSATLVVWQNFPTQPTNMADGDLWFDASSGGVLLSGTAAPTGSDGANGDFWINTTPPVTVYGPKASGAWPSGVSIKGDTGSTGATGQGVPTGGSTGQVLAKTSGTDYATAWQDGAYTPDSFYRLPTGASAATFDRMIPTVNSTLTSGTVYLTAIVFRAGTVVTNLNQFMGTSLFSGVTHSWMGLFNTSRVALRLSADSTTVPSVSTVRTFPLTSTYTITTTGLYFIGTLWAATTMGTTTTSVAGSGPAYLTLTPAVHGASSTGQTTPPAEGATMGAMTTHSSPILAWAS